MPSIRCSCPNRAQVSATRWAACNAPPTAPSRAQTQYATEADRGKVAWKVRTPCPILAGVTATAAGLVFTADMGGTVHAFDGGSGKKLWQFDAGGAVGGGVIRCDSAKDAQRAAVAAGMTSPIWPTKKVNAKIVVCGLQ
jgi:alcohol dehydrogenase (cytochrome c)